ncbi:MAG: hypothetical protein K2N56_07310 [Oscillospiraceae bacterium]|nr:hypothetical protein [Oscillospiraceae bacterium]
MKKTAFVLICSMLILQLCGCAVSEQLPEDISDNGSSSSEQSTTLSAEPAPEPNPEKVYLDPADYLPSTADYVQQIVREHVAKIEKPDMTEYEKVKAAADYVMSIGYYTVSPALDVWRWRTAGDSVPTYEEMRGLNMLLFGAETCEGYTAALNLLLNEMGVETRYITGLTYMARGGLGYHSWSQVKIDGVWYHLDCDLEDNISSSGYVNYKYFLRSDATMSRSHYWGQRLINLGQLAEAQVEEVREKYMGENCPRDYPTPARNYIEVNERPDIRELRKELTLELTDFEETYGELEYMELDVVPPVFIKYYCTLDEVPEGEENMSHFAKTYQDRRSIMQNPDAVENPDYEIPWASGSAWGV